MYRKKTRAELMKRIVGQISRHPIARRRLVRSLTRALVWQVWKRAVRVPLRVRFETDQMLVCYPDSQSASNVMYFGHLFDFNEMSFTWRVLHPGDAYLDAGANIGTYTLLAAAAMEDRGVIDAVEPHPVAVRRLEENLKINGLEALVTVHDLALGGHLGRAQFTADADVSNRIISTDKPGRSVIEVPTATLTSFLDSREYFLMKLDIEGAESAALFTARVPLSSGNPAVLMFEATPHLLEANGSSVEQLRDFLIRCGYDLHVYEESSGALSTPTSWRGNLIGVHRSRRAIVEQRLRNSSDPPDSSRLRLVAPLSAHG